MAFIFVTDGSEERTTQLNFVLYHLLPKLRDQKLDFCVYLAVQNSPRSARDEFNKGVLINAAFVEAMADRHWDCVCLHDVDLVVQGNTNLYSCPSDHVQHLVSGVDRWLWQLPYEELAGGASVIMSEHFRLINGLSTAYWGWGGEDDDFFTRVKHSNLTWQKKSLESWAASPSSPHKLCLESERKPRESLPSSKQQTAPNGVRLDHAAI